MISKNTVIEQIEITRTGRVQIRFQLRVTEDGADIAEPRLHRTAIDPGTDVDAMLSNVDADITKRPDLKAAPITRDDGMVDVLKAIVKQVHTPSVVAEYRKAMQQRQKDAV